MINFTVYGEPNALKRHRTFRRGNVNINVDPSKGNKADFLALSHANKPESPLDEPVKVDICCHFSRAKGHYGTGKNSDKLKKSAPTYHTKTPDADNLGKFVCDALNGVFWRDDSCIAELTVTKVYTNDFKPRTDIHVASLEIT